MDKILITLLFIIIGVGSIIGIENWTNNKKNDLYNKANAEYINTLK